MNLLNIDTMSCTKKYEKNKKISIKLKKEQIQCRPQKLENLKILKKIRVIL